MNFNTLVRAAMRKRAAAVLTPEAEQAAMQPQDPSMMQQGAALQGQGPQGGQIPPEIMNDQQFLQWLAQQGVQFDPNSGMFYDLQGQPIPAEMITQAYQQYQTEMQGGQMAPQGQPMPQDPNAMPPQGAPQDPNAMGGMPPADPNAMPPQDPNMAAQQDGMPPQDPSMMQQPMPPQGAPAQGQLPPEVLNDQMFMQFMQEAMGAQFDPNSGSFLDPQSGQPIPPDMIMQAYQAFQQQRAQQQGGAPQDPNAMPPQGAAPQDPSMMPQGAPSQVPPELLEQLQSAVDASIQNYTAQLDKKIETLMDKLETVKMALESLRDTDDKRTAQDRADAAAVRDEIAADLQPTVKTASVRAPKQARISTPKPINMFDLLRR